MPTSPTYTQQYEYLSPSPESSPIDVSWYVEHTSVKWTSPSWSPRFQYSPLSFANTTELREFIQMHGNRFADVPDEEIAFELHSTSTK